MWLFVSNCTGRETVKQSTFGTGQGLLHSLNIYNTGPISLAQKCTGGENVKHSTSPISKGKGMFHSLNMHNTNRFLPIRCPNWREKLGLSVVYLLHTYKSSPSELINHVSCDSSGFFSRKYTKTHMLTYFGAKHLAHRGHFTHTLKSYYNIPVNQVLGSDIKNLYGKWRNTSKIPNFDLLFVIKNP